MLYKKLTHLPLKLFPILILTRLVTRDERRSIAKHVDSAMFDSDSDEEANDDSDDARKYLDSEHSDGKYNSEEPLEPPLSPDHVYAVSSGSDTPDSDEYDSNSDSNADENDSNSDSNENDSDNMDAGGFMSNLTQVLIRHGIDAKKETDVQGYPFIL